MCTLGYAVDGPSGLGQNGLEGLEAGFTDLFGEHTVWQTRLQVSRILSVSFCSPISYNFTHFVHFPSVSALGFTDLFSEQKSGKPDCKSAAVAQ